MADDDIRNLVTNRRARHDYELLDHFEAGVVLQGSEVKSLRAGRANLQEAFVRVEDGEAWLMGCHISPYAEAGPHNNHVPVRPRKLLLHGSEIRRLEKAVGAKGLTIVPLRIYVRGRYIKVEIAVGRGKKQHDKRRDLKKQAHQREMDRHR